MKNYQDFLTAYQALPEPDKKVINEIIHQIVIGNTRELVSPGSPASQTMQMFYSLEKPEDRKPLAELVEWLFFGNEMPIGETLAEMVSEMEMSKKIQMQLMDRLTTDDIERGKTIPASFLRALADTASEAVRVWIESKNAPKPLLELIDSIIMMERFSSTLEAGGELGKWDYDGLTGNITDMIKLIADFGGDFYGATGSYPSKESTIVWKTAEE